MRRRTFLGGASLLGVATALPRFAIAEAAIGGGTVRTLSDGHLTLPRDFILGGLPEAEVAAILAAQGVADGPLEPPCNVTLYQDAERTVLFDVGSGSDFMPTAGELLDSLDALGVAPEDVTHILFTHAHPDHLWGLLDDFGDLAFPEAELMIGRDEWDYWTDPATVETIGAERQTFAVGAERRLREVEDLVSFFGDGDEVLPGIAAVATYGHTPGHMSFEIGGGSESLFVIGDAIGNGHVSLARPDWKVNSDQDPETGAATRAALAERLGAAKALVAGFHLPAGGLGRIEKIGDGFGFVPV